MQIQKSTEKFSIRQKVLFQCQLDLPARPFEIFQKINEFVIEIHHK